MFRIKFILLPMMIIVFAECASGPRIVIKKSIEELQKAVDNDPNDHFAHYNIGIGYTIKKDYEQALNAFRRTLEINPHFAEAYFAIYCVEYEKDSKLYAESLKEQPSSEMEGKIQEIGNYLKSAFMYNPFFDWKLSTILLEKRPTSPYPYIQELIDAVYNLVFDGFRQFSLGNYKNAVKKFEFIIENFPEFIQARLFRGLAYAQLNNYDSAISDFQFVIDKLEEYNKKKILPIYLNPSDIYYLIGYAHLQQGKLDKAEQSFKQVIVEQLSFYMAHFRLSHIYKQRGDYAQALRELDAALMIEPNDATIHFNKGVFWRQLGSVQKAAEEYKAAVSINPNYCKAYYNLATTLEELGRKEEAITNYKKFVRTAPNRFSLLNL